MIDGVPISPEPFMTRRQLAEHMQVHERTIDRWAKEGMPHQVWGKRTKRFRASEAEAWAIRHGREAAASDPLRPSEDSRA